MGLKHVRKLPVDLALQETKQPIEQVLNDMNKEVGRTLQAGGQVLVADILHPLDWEAPWMSLLGRGITKARVTNALLDGREARRMPGKGGIEVWELRPNTATGLVSK